MNKYASKLGATKKVAKTPTSADSQPSDNAQKVEIDPLAQYSESDLKDVVTLSVKLPKVVRDAIRVQCSQRGIKLATEAKRWIVETFEMPEGFEDGKLLEDNRHKKL